MPLRRAQIHNSKIQSMAQKTDENSLYLPVTTLPSKFLPYPKGVRISYRRYGWMEVKYLSQAASSLTSGEKIQIAMEGIYVEGMDKYDLTGPDFLYIELLRKISTTNPPHFEVAYLCPKCRTTVSFIVQIRDLVFEDLDVPALPAVAKLSFGEMSFSPITVGNQEFLDSLDIPDTYRPSSFMAACCTSHDYDTAFELITKRCDIKDVQVLEHIDSLFDHGLRSVVNTCGFKIPSYHEIHGVHYQSIMDQYKTEEHAKILQLMKSKGFKPSNPNEVSQTDVNLFLEEHGYVTYEICGRQTSLALDGGEGFVLPFRFTRDDVVNSVSFGD